MRYSVMTFMFKPWWTDGRLSHEGLIAGLAGEGVDAVEPFHTVFVDDPDLIVRYNRALRDHGMRVSAVDIICNLVYASPAQKRKGRDDLGRGLEICAALGAEVAHVAGHGPKEGVALGDARQMIADGLLEQADFAVQHGLTLAVEDFGGAPTMLCRAEDMLDLLRRTGDAVRLVFDTGNFELADEQADRNFDALYEHTCYIHFKDWRLVDRSQGEKGIGRGLTGCPLGEGVVPNEAVARMFKASGYDGWVALEATPAAAGPIATVQRDLPVLRKWLA